MDESENKHTLLLIRARLRVCASSNHQPEVVWKRSVSEKANSK
jgi:hypothetical protein